MSGQGRGYHHREAGAGGSNLTACLIEASDSMTSPICMGGREKKKEAPLGIIKPSPGQASKARTTCSCLRGEHASQTNFRAMERLETHTKKDNKTRSGISFLVIFQNQRVTHCKQLKALSFNPPKKDNKAK